MKTGLKTATVLLVATKLGLAQASASTTAPNTTASNAAAARSQAVPGTINYVEGQATLNGQALGSNATGYAIAQPNAAIQTEAGNVEVLLTPGTFLRIGHNSKVVFHATGLTNIQLEVVRGSAMIEVADLVKGTTMQITMNGANAQIEKRGLYQFDANQQLVRVIDGKAKVIDGSHAKDIGKGDQIVLANANFKSHGFDKKSAEADSLYVWSKARSAAEAQANVAVARDVAVYGGWYGPGWYWNPFWAQYAFLPAAGYLYSPFGWGLYSPGFVYAAPLYRPLYHPFYGRVGFAAGVHTGALHRSAISGFHGGVRR
jgi:hypothetical protein